MPRYIIAADGNMILERRTMPRFEVSLEVEINVGRGRESLFGTTTNISAVGVQVLTPAAVPGGTVLDFRCPTFAGSMELIWSRPEGDRVRSGFRFAMLSRENRDALLRLIANLRLQSTLEYAAAG